MSRSRFLGILFVVLIRKRTALRSFLVVPAEGNP